MISGSPGLGMERPSIDVSWLKKFGILERGIRPAARFQTKNSERQCILLEDIFFSDSHYPPGRPG